MDEVEGTEIPVEISYPSLAEGAGLPNDGSKFPLVVFEHGNTHVHTNYEELLDMLTAHGFVVANIASGSTSSSISRSAREYCTTARLIDGQENWQAEGRLSGDAFIMGHSTGGEGAIRAARMTKSSGVFDEPGRRLAGAVAIAPACNESTTFFERGDTGVFVVQSSRDADTPYCLFEIGDRSDGEEEFFVAPNAAPQVVVLSHGFGHEIFGGSNPPTTMGRLMYEYYLVPFLELQAFELNEHRGRFFGTGLEIPPEIDDPQLWPFNFIEGEAPVFGSVTDASGGAFNRIVLDAFENTMPPQPVTVSTRGGSVTWDPELATLTEDAASNLGAGPSLTRALNISASAGAAVTWEFDEDLGPQIAGGASYLRFRLGVDPRADVDACQATQTHVPPIRVRLSDSNSDSPALNINDYARLRPADVHVQGGGGLAGSCGTKISLQSSVRIPLADFCADGSLVLDELSSLELSFDEDVSVIIDNIEFGQSPGDPSLSDCTCLNSI